MRENVVKKHARHDFSQFELSKNVLNNLKQWGLKNTTKLVLLVLVDCYNPDNGAVIFPSLERIADIADISLTSTKEAINELIKKGLIIKSKRNNIRGNFNKYLLTLKVQNSTSEQPENENFKQSENDHFMIRTKKNEQKKEQTTNVEDFKILKSYAESKGAKNVTSYIAALKRNGSAEKIVKDFKTKEAADKFYAQQIKETEARNAQNRIWVAESPKECATLQEVLKKLSK